MLFRQRYISNQLTLLSLSYVPPFPPSFTSHPRGPPSTSHTHTQNSKLTALFPQPKPKAQGIPHHEAAAVQRGQGRRAGAHGVGGREPGRDGPEVVRGRGVRRFGGGLTSLPSFPPPPFPPSGPACCFCVLDTPRLIRQSYLRQFMRLFLSGLYVLLLGVCGARVGSVWRPVFGWHVLRDHLAMNFTVFEFLIPDAPPTPCYPVTNAVYKKNKKPTFFQHSPHHHLPGTPALHPSSSRISSGCTSFLSLLGSLRAASSVRTRLPRWNASYCRCSLARAWCHTLAPTW